MVAAVLCACSGGGTNGAGGGSGGGTGGGTGGGSVAGTVTADLRDVERAGEGLFSTTFGTFPARTPDWGRAAMVQTILKTVWGRTKSANPTYPSAQVAAVDKAIVDLDAAITAMDQKKATFAANAVGLAMPELFDFFHPDAPFGVR